MKQILKASHSLIRTIALAGLLTTITSTPYFAVAQDDAVDEKVAEVADSVMSPFCPGKLLSGCPSAKASELKDEIRGKVIAGQSKESIIQELKDQFGEQTMIAEPETRGFGLVAWIIPVVFLLGGLILILFFIRGAAKKSE